MPTCPKCPDTDLHHTLLMDNLPAYGCPHCSGLLLSLLVYRHWRETEVETKGVAHGQTPRESADDSDEALECPKCSGLMTKYRFSAIVENRIDLCARCEELWFDPGEWALVEQIARSGHLAEVFGKPWQRRIRREVTDEMETLRLQTLLGDDYPQFEAFRKWYATHPEKSRLLAVLTRKRRR